MDKMAPVFAIGPAGTTCVNTAAQQLQKMFVTPVGKLP